MQHDGAILSGGIEHYGIVALRNHFTHDVNTFGFEALKMRQVHGGQTYAARCLAVKLIAR
jgi:hypothetical protein